ncbi:MAG: uracil-DNA glycosylase [Nitrospirota bacterium]|nr:MAG: uracil-DNA glycosylase [Nitrospirota bacterium]
MGNLLSRQEKQRALEDLMKDGIGDCRRCRLSETRTNIVFGEGDPDCEIMFIGEGPGADEDMQGRPFVGRAGQVLTSLINKMGFEREEVYIANIVKCRPPDNRNPHSDEAESCLPFLKRQIEVISPKVIMVMGNVALQNLLDPDMRITKVRGKFQDLFGIKVMPTFHPSYLMRNPKDKWLTWEDAVTVLKFLGRDVVHDPGRG